MSDEILAHSQPLSSSGNTGIGFNEKFSGGGINWKFLKIIAQKLLEEGKITKYVDKDGITRVDLNGLESIEVGTTSRSLINY